MSAGQSFSLPVVRDPATGVELCPHCRRPLPQGAHVCTGCGAQASVSMLPLGAGGCVGLLAALGTAPTLAPLLNPIFGVGGVIICALAFLVVLPVVGAVVAVYLGRGGPRHFRRRYRPW